MRPAFKSAALALAFSAGSLFAQSSDDVILGALRIGSLADLAATAGDFADHVRPGSGSASAQLTAVAARFGLDPAGEILAFVIDPQKSAAPFAFVVTTLDPETIKGNPVFGFKPAAQSDRYQIALGRQTMFAVFVGKRLVVSQLESGLDAVLPAVRSGEDIRRLREAGGQLAIDLSTARLYAAFKPMLDGIVSGMRGRFAKAASAAAPPPNPADVFASFIGSIGELQRLSLSVSIRPDHLELRSLVDARPGTAAAALLSPGRGPAVTTLGLHDQASAFFATVSAKPGPDFWRAYDGLVANWLAASGIPAPLASKTGKTISKAINDFAAIWDGTASFAMLSAGERMSGSGVIGITDQAWALTQIQSIPELRKNLVWIGLAQGIVEQSVLAAEESYHGARLIDITQTFRAINPAKDAGLKPLQKIGLDRMTATYAVTPNQVLYAQGDNSRATAKRFVDATGPAATTVTPVTYGLPERTTIFAAISLPRSLTWIARAYTLPIQTDDVAADLKPGLALSADLDAGRVDLRIYLAASEIAALMRMAAPPPIPTPASTNHP